jgi:hypothetical protein
MKFRYIILIVASFLLGTAHASADIWRHPEIASKNSLFTEVGIAPLMFTEGFDNFSVFPLELRIDYLPPLPLPFSTGIFLKTPAPNLKSFGTRLAYHFDLRMPSTDLYFVYVFDFGFFRNDLLEEYNDTPAPMYLYDFRLGIRYFFDSIIGLSVESDFKVFGIIFLLSIKII